MSFSRIIILMSVLLVSCASNKPQTFVESHDEAGVWKTIQLHNDYGFFANKNQEIWRRVVDVLSEKYDLEVLDKTSGYIRSSWKHSDDGNNKYRSRVILKMQGSPWDIAKLKTEAQWKDSGESWIIGYDTAILEDIYKDVQGRVGTSVK